MSAPSPPPWRPTSPTRLISQKRASRHTIAAYRDAFRLLLHFAEQQTGKAPSLLGFEDLDAPLIGAFLDHLEHARGNTTQSRNARLAAIHSLFRFAALSATPSTPLSSPACSPYRPNGDADRSDVSFLTHAECKALLAASQPRTAGPVGATTP